jgi:hypothetical protein
MLIFTVISHFRISLTVECRVYKQRPVEANVKKCSMYIDVCEIVCTYMSVHAFVHAGTNVLCVHVKYRSIFQLIDCKSKQMSPRP